MMTNRATGAPAGQTMRLLDGRRLGYAEYGRAEGPVLLYFHGHPGSRLEACFLAPAADQMGMRLIGVDRPGLGWSSYQPGRRLLDWPADVAALANHLQIDRFGVVGYSGGGPYALACAYMMPERLTACGVIAGVGRTGPGLSFLSRWAPWLLLPLARHLFRDEAQARQVLTRVAQRWGAPDREALTRPGVTEILAASLVAALKPGVRGAAYDGGVLGRAWGFPLAGITLANLYLWHGTRDKEVPVAMGRAVAEQLAHCQATYYPGEGHISLIVNRAGAIVTALMRAAARG